MQNEPLAQEKEPGNDRISLLQHVTVPFAPLLYPSSSATPPPSWTTRKRHVEQTLPLSEAETRIVTQQPKMLTDGEYRGKSNKQKNMESGAAQRENKRNDKK